MLLDRSVGFSPMTLRGRLWTPYGRSSLHKWFCTKRWVEFGGPYNEDYECSVFGTNAEYRLRYSCAAAVSPVLQPFVGAPNNLNFVALTTTRLSPPGPAPIPASGALPLSARVIS